MVGRVVGERAVAVVFGVELRLSSDCILSYALGVGLAPSSLVYG